MLTMKASQGLLSTLALLSLMSECGTPAAALAERYRAGAPLE
jgi:hypothetical protein